MNSRIELLPEALITLIEEFFVESLGQLSHFHSVSNKLVDTFDFLNECNNGFLKGNLKFFVQVLLLSRALNYIRV